MHVPDDFVWRGSAGGEADPSSSLEPFGADFDGVLHLVGASADCLARSHQLTRIVAAPAADDDDDVASSCEASSGGLALASGATGGVVMADVRGGEAAADGGHHRSDVFRRLRR